MKILKTTTFYTALTIFLWTAGITNICSQTNHLFPQANTYPNGIKPDCIDQETMNRDCLQAYDDFIMNSVTGEGCPPGVNYRVHIGESVVFGGSEPYDTYSEGIGWGMLLSVIMDNDSNNAREYFDHFNLYRKAYRNSNGLMNWHIGNNGEVKASGIAVEADENMAMALMLAHYKWGSDAGQNYENDAREIMQALMDHCVQSPEMYMKPGDTWGGYDLVHPCNFDVCYYEDWERFSSDSLWLEVKNESYEILQKIFSKYPSGFLPHWCNYNGNIPTGKGEYFEDYTYEYDALQTSFKITLDYLLNGVKTHPLAYSIPFNLSNSVRESSNDDIKSIGSGYDLDGNIVNPSGGSSAFIGAFGVAAMVSSEHQQWCNSIYTELRNKSTGGKYGYYNDIIRAFCLIIMSGNYPVLGYYLNDPGSTEGKQRTNFTDLTFYPNPANDLLNFKSNEPGQYLIEIKTLGSQLIYSSKTKLADLKIDLSAFQDGIYLISVISEDFVMTEKIVKL